MGQRELIFTLSAIAIFGVISLSVNRSVVGNTDAISARQAEFYAANVAQSFIEEAKNKAFDEVSIAATPPNLPSDFTNPGLLGPEGSEAYPNFDDIDDYHSFADTVGTAIGDMTVNISVRYVQESDWNTPFSNETFYKRMRVAVRSEYLRRPVAAEYVFAFQKNH